LGWSEGRNLRFDYLWEASADNPDRIRRYAMELVALAPDVILHAGDIGELAVLDSLADRDRPVLIEVFLDPASISSPYH